MAKRLVQGPAEPVWLVGADGEPIDAARPLDVSDAGAIGSAAVLGTIADAAIITDAPGTLSGKLRGLVALMVNLLSRWPAALGGGGGLSVDVAPVTAAAADVNAPAVNTAAVVTYGAAATTRHVITGVAWSYVGGIPTGGNLTITDAGATVFNIDIAEEGPGFFSFPSPKRSALVNTAMVITLAAGGAGITGKLSVLNHWTV